MFSKYFAQKGHPCTVCNNSHNAVDMITTGQYDIILLDLAMPEFSGTDIVDTLYQNGKIGKLNIVALTASSVSSEKAEELKRKGVNIVLKKPIDPDDLLDILQQLHSKLIYR
jgi:two-component system, OmpR family, response regulator